MKKPRNLIVDFFNSNQSVTVAFSQNFGMNQSSISPAPPVNSQKFLILTQQNLEMQKIIDSQAQQINLLKKEIEENTRQISQLTNYNDELRQKYLQNRAMQQKMAVIKESLEKDFLTLKETLTERNYVIEMLGQEKQNLLKQLQEKVSREKNHSEQIFEKERNLVRAEALIESLKQQNESLQTELRRMKIQNLDTRLDLRGISLQTEETFEREEKKVKGGKKKRK